MSEIPKTLTIPSHLRLDSLSLTNFPTGFTPRSEVKSSIKDNYTLLNGIERGILEQLPVGRSFRTSIRVNRDVPTLLSTRSNPNNSIFNISENIPKKPINSKVTKPKAFEFATIGRAEYRSRQSSKPLSSLNLNLHKINQYNIPNGPLSVRSATSVGAESRCSNRSSKTTVPKPFNFSTDARAINRSKCILEKLNKFGGKLSNKRDDTFNVAVLSKNEEYNEDKRLNNIVESMKKYVGNIDNNSPIYNDGYKSILKASSQIKEVTKPISPKFATKARFEKKKAQPVVERDCMNNGVLYQKLCKDVHPNIMQPRIQGTKMNPMTLSKYDVKLGEKHINRNFPGNKCLNINKKKNSNISNIELDSMRNIYITPKENLRINCDENNELNLREIEYSNEDSETIKSSLPPLCGFLSMSSLASNGRLSSDEKLSNKNEKWEVNYIQNKQLVEDFSAFPGINNDNGDTIINQDSEDLYNNNNHSIHTINARDKNIPINWKFQATIARKQLEELISPDSDSQILDEEIPCITDIIKAQSVNLGFDANEEIRTPIVRKF
ncbi:uncharacterized protein CMU_007120 [Cryptosporidium muris RN66]|uniref:Uncharacterized protein n=1 Tax=Cryptosporidium muris (strain RN66) TaxID=441375 RepID=B6ADD2_CRYMR|nr:uncharacterized protein CMU_007120 [Cryptosporidium muris RN66]EEA06223.1 hypothetical protein, conserved [Cryptosporidium muris RN66]|eukprot:XP_002140572.1 hypothetical protein [Cryptosporidium muris RN66]